MEKFQELKQFLGSLETDFQKFYQNGNKAAGVRLRKAMQDIKSKAQDIRTEIQARKGE